MTSVKWVIVAVATPVRAANYAKIHDWIGSNSEVCQLDHPIFSSQNICTLDVAMYHALIVKID